MKCPNCGGESLGEVCEYCGSELPKESQPVIHITNHYHGGSAPTEPYGEFPAYQQPYSSKKSNKNLVWWVLGWVFFFPVPLTVLLVRNKSMRPGIKYTIIALLWIVLLIWGMALEEPSAETPTDVSSATVSSVQEPL